MLVRAGVVGAQCKYPSYGGYDIVKTKHHHAHIGNRETCEGNFSFFFAGPLKMGLASHGIITMHGSACPQSASVQHRITDRKRRRRQQQHQRQWIAFAHLMASHRIASYVESKTGTPSTQHDRPRRLFIITSSFVADKPSSSA